MISHCEVRTPPPHPLISGHDCPFCIGSLIANLLYPLPRFTMSFGVGVGDVIKVSQIAFRLCCSIRDALVEQESLARELEFFKHLVKLISDRVADTQLPLAIASSTGQQLAQCHQILLKLNQTTTKYLSRCANGNTSHRFTRVKWGVYKRSQCLQLLNDLRSLTNLLDFLLRSYTSYVYLFESFI